MYKGQNYETGLGFVAPESGTYYVRVEGYEATMTGGYTLDVTAGHPPPRGPPEIPQLGPSLLYIPPPPRPGEKSSAPFFL